MNIVGQRIVTLRPRDDAAGAAARDLIEDAIANGRLELHYQQQFRADGALAGVEALARIRTGAGELVSPDRFIGYAEQSGLIHTLGLEVLEVACADLVRFRAAGVDLPRMAVNLSPVQLDDPHLASAVQAVVRRHGLRLADLQFELTESALAGDCMAARRVCEQLSEGGASLAMDDFGAGCSTLSRLASLPFDVLKLDRRFVAQVPHSGRGERLMGAVLDMGQRLGLDMVVEGVETEAQRRWVAGRADVKLQGFGLHRPEADPFGVADVLDVAAAG